MWRFQIQCSPTSIQMNLAETQIKEDVFTHARWFRNTPLLFCSFNNYDLFYKMTPDRSFFRENRLVVVSAWLCTQQTHYGAVSFIFLSCLLCSVYRTMSVFSAQEDATEKSPQNTPSLCPTASGAAKQVTAVRDTSSSFLSVKNLGYVWWGDHNISTSG